MMPITAQMTVITTGGTISTSPIFHFIFLFVILQFCRDQQLSLSNKKQKIMKSDHEEGTFFELYEYHMTDMGLNIC